MTQHKLKVGDRVEYTGSGLLFAPEENRTGVVTKLYEGFCPASLKPYSYPRDWSAGVRLDELPKAWPYYPSDKFAPQVIDLRLVG